MPRHASVVLSSRRRALQGLLTSAGALLAGCSGSSSLLNSFTSPTPPQQSAQAPPGATIGTGEVKAGLILPLSAGGNAGVAGQSMRNAAEMAIAEFNAPNITLLLKDDGGTAEAARLGAQQALDEGAEIILGPLFAQSVGAVAQHPGHRVFDRRQCGVGGGLSAEFPAGVRRRSHRAICRLDRETLLRRAD